MAAPLLVLVEGVDGEAGEQLGVEVGGLLWHDVHGERDVLELVERDGLDEKGHVGFAAGDQAYRLVDFADEADVAQLGDGVGAEAEDTIEDDGMELDDVELGLTGGNVRQLLGD